MASCTFGKVFWRSFNFKLYQSRSKSGNLIRRRWNLILAKHKSAGSHLFTLRRAWLPATKICKLFPFHLRLLILSFSGTLEALQGIIYAGSEWFRANCFEKPTPPAWGEDEVSAILDATGGRVDGSAGDVWFHLQAQWEKS